MVTSTFIALWLSSYFHIFTENRGQLQFVVVIPLTSLVTAGILTYYRMITSTHMLWAMLPVAGLIILAIGELGPGYAAWPWMFATGGIMFIPWVIGSIVGSGLRQNNSGKQK